MVAMAKRQFRVYATCNKCSETECLLVDRQDFIDWREGKCIQDAMPYLSVDERELMISRICGDCFDKIFPGPTPPKMFEGDE